MESQIMTAKPESGPPESLADSSPAEAFDAERRFGQLHAKLFLLLGRKVRTPGGPGTLLQVFADRVTVVLDREVKKCSFFSPTEVEPVNARTGQDEEP
jgi:hypothetical protein